MLAEVYVERVKELLESEPGSELTAPEVCEALSITYEVARSCLSNMHRNGLVNRDGLGKKGKPFRYSIPISNPNTFKQDKSDSPNPTSSHGSGERGIGNEASDTEYQNPLAYKD